jgi:hypothetical protein
MKTTILGQDYEGRPGMNSVALRVLRLEEAGDVAGAMAYLKAVNKARSCFVPQPCHDLQSDMTLIPMEGVQLYPVTKGNRAHVG